MGQAMDKPRPTAELLYELASTGNIVAVKALREQGVSLEWADREGKTPLIVACMNHELFDVAKTLIELGANINAYSPGRHAGTPLHHAAKRGLAQSVKLLLSHGAKALVRDDDSQTPLDVARINGHTSIVREIEKSICYFSGWLREFYGPGFLEALMPLLLSREIWVVVIPWGSSNSTMPRKMELFIYPDLQTAQPCTVIALWKAKIEEPKFQQKDPELIIFDQPTRTRNTLTSPFEGDKQQLQQLYNACIGIPQTHCRFARAQPPQTHRRRANPFQPLFSIFVDLARVSALCFGLYLCFGPFSFVFRAFFGFVFRAVLGLCWVFVLGMGFGFGVLIFWIFLFALLH
ncbi:putative E3 ubiquitin-protein ligase XBAT35 [Quercus lobata]|uniref:putative E3 ubiquitin-protein ligase XBAT35 n=1 Tax=Quercus lobata TaxID=97700 RepID=UPI0012492CD8|nr:putative E3 ubiquitin-protein ligase XBAT35 [Quercus lobata]